MRLFQPFARSELVLLAVLNTTCTLSASDPPECWAPPRCGEASPEPGRVCLKFATTCVETGIIIGRGQCYDFVPCSGPNRCVEIGASAICAESIDDCGTVRDAYEKYVKNTFHLAEVRSGSGPLAPGIYDRAGSPWECSVLQGHCAQGLDTCWLVGNEGALSSLDRYASLYQSLGCPSLGPCDCPAQPQVSWKPEPQPGTDAGAGPYRCFIE
jgi:hypothetical protein